MADNRAIARALCAKYRALRGPSGLVTLSAPEPDFVNEIAAALDAAFSRGSASIADEAAHPWLAFLESRAAVIDWFHTEGKSDAEIAATLSMDPAQVQMIRTRARAALAAIPAPPAPLKERKT